MANESIESCGAEGCTFDGLTGTCAVHSLEVERRKNLEKMAENIPRLLTFMNRTIGAVTIVTSIWLLSITASITYTTITNNAEVAERRMEIARLEAARKADIARLEAAREKVATDIKQHHQTEVARVERRITATETLAKEVLVKQSEATGAQVEILNLLKHEFNKE